jgi:uncharacterized protein YdhG (YjbR/CyaY superfamily)
MGATGRSTSTSPTRKSAEVDAYIAAAPRAAQPRLRALRKLVREVAPDAQERLSYGMPFYEFEGRLIYFSAFKNHIGIYPVGEAEKHKDLKPYLTGKGTYRFPLDQPMPLDLIKRVVQVRAADNLRKAESARLSSSSRPTSGGAGRASRRASR